MACPLSSKSWGNVELLLFFRKDSIWSLNLVWNLQQVCPIYFNPQSAKFVGRHCCVQIWIFCVVGYLPWESCWWYNVLCRLYLNVIWWGFFVIWCLNANICKWGPYFIELSGWNLFLVFVNSVDDVLREIGDYMLCVKLCCILWACYYEE